RCWGRKGPEPTSRTTTAGPPPSPMGITPLGHTRHQSFRAQAQVAGQEARRLMATFSGVCEAGAGSATLPFAGIYAGSSTRLIVREIKVFTTAANAARIRIQRA